MNEAQIRIEGLRVAADPGAWLAAGFTVQEDRLSLGTTPVRLGGAAPIHPGIAAWALRGVEDASIDGLPSEPWPRDPGRGSSAEHPNGALAVDHVVVLTSSLERTIRAFEANGIRCRRVREVGPPDEQLRQAFFRLGEVICEVVEVPEDQAGPNGARFWGLTITVADLERAVAELGDERCGTIRDAVQPGRRIATLRKGAGLGLPVALISPEPPAQDR